MKSELTGAVYVVTRYKRHDNGTIEAMEKHDVTERFERLAAEAWADSVAAAVDNQPEPTALGADGGMTGMCPHCGEEVEISEGLTAYHNWPKPLRQVCPGSKQNARCAASDARPLWNGEPNLRFARGSKSHD